MRTRFFYLIGGLVVAAWCSQAIAQDVPAPSDDATEEVVLRGDDRDDDGDRGPDWRRGDSERKSDSPRMRGPRDGDRDRPQGGPPWMQQSRDGRPPFGGFGPMGFGPRGFGQGFGPGFGARGPKDESSKESKVASEPGSREKRGDRSQADRRGPQAGRGPWSWQGWDRGPRGPQPDRGQWGRRDSGSRRPQGGPPWMQQSRGGRPPMPGHGPGMGFGDRGPQCGFHCPPPSMHGYGPRHDGRQSFGRGAWGGWDRKGFGPPHLRGGDRPSMPGWGAEMRRGGRDFDKDRVEKPRKDRGDKAKKDRGHKPDRKDSRDSRGDRDDD